MMIHLTCGAESWLQIGQGFFAFAAAGLWLCASLIRVPTDIKSGYGKLIGVDEMSAGFKRQARWNAYAALCAGIAAFLSAVPIITPTCLNLG
jgi:hypothetical protein